jgi:hypothetical protein
MKLQFQGAAVTFYFSDRCVGSERGESQRNFTGNILK